MPHLVLAFEANREVKDAKRSRSGIPDLTPTGKESFKFKMIDTDKGEVVELSADATNIKQEVRPPNFAELDTASKALGKDVANEIALEQFQEIQAERDSYRQKHLSAENQINSQKRIIDSLDREVTELRDQTYTEPQRKILADALDEKIMQFAALQDWEKYESSKKMYRSLTGESWADDDEEGD
jgi:hypothetical protein